MNQDISLFTFQSLWLDHLASVQGKGCHLAHFLQFKAWTADIIICPFITKTQILCAFYFHFELWFGAFSVPMANSYIARNSGFTCFPTSFLITSPIQLVHVWLAVDMTRLLSHKERFWIRTQKHDAGTNRCKEIQFHLESCRSQKPENQSNWVNRKQTWHQGPNSQSGNQDTKMLQSSVNTLDNQAESEWAGNTGWRERDDSSSGRIWSDGRVSDVFHIKHHRETRRRVIAAQAG